MSKKKPKLMPVPTVAELLKHGLAEIVESTKGGAPTHYRIKKKGYKMIREAERHNAAVLKPLVDDVEAKRSAYLAAQAKLQKVAARK